MGLAGPVRVLTVNAGSSSLKLALLDGDDLAGERHVESWGGEPEPIEEFLGEHGAEIIGHRVVHGGDLITEATVVDDDVQNYLESIADLAPLHQPRAIDGIRVARRVAPGVPSVVCVDTAFHARLPAAAATYALPREWNERYGLRRYGFHGLSHSYAVRRGAELAGMEPGRGKVLSCHLGAGASMAAVLNGRCVDTTMGFTPEEGLVMNTRSGSIDPGLIGWLIDARGVAPQEVFETLARRSGIAGLAGGAWDLREVMEARENGDHDAATAFDVYRHSLVRHAGAMLAVLGGLDLLVFTGGIGEHQPPVRAAVGSALVFAGAAIDPAHNIHTGEGEISAAGAAARSVVVHAREDLEIARQSRVAVAVRG